MKKVNLILISFTVIFLLTSPCVSAPLQEAKDFELKDINGNNYRLSDLKGKVVLLNFWATWCKVCLKENPSLDRLYSKFKDKGFMVLGISIDRYESMVQNYLIKHPLSFPVLMDPKGDVFVKTYTLRGVPFTILINKEGHIVEKIPGAQDFDSSRYTELLNGLLKENQ